MEESGEPAASRASGDGGPASDSALLAWGRMQAALGVGDAAGALRWVERAHRLVPEDAVVALTVGSLRLAGGDAAAAAAAFATLAGAEAAAGLAACRLALGNEGPAASALALALRDSVVTTEVAGLAGRIGRPWCGVGRDGRLRTGGGVPGVVRLDGRDVEPGPPIGDGEALVVEGPDGPFLGSPLPVRRLRATLGFVAETDDGIAGWAWHPADPGRAVRLTVSGPGGRRTIAGSGPAEGVTDLPPLARPQRVGVAAEVLAALGSPVAVVDAAGRHLLGSPIWRGRVPDPGAVAAPAIDQSPRAVDVVVPVYSSPAATMACLESVLATVPAGSVVHVVDDASPEAGLAAALDALAAAGRIRLHRHAQNLGFPAAANTGLRAASGRDVVLLNSDTVVPPGWLERLRAAAYASADTGTATPLSGDGSIVSYDGAGTAAALDAAARLANAGGVAPLPVGVGFCLYVRRDCLAQAGPLREDLFAQGYGEESEFCLRARRRGWQHVAALDVFVAHAGGLSFGAGRAALRRRNQALLERHYPDYAGLIAAHAAADPLFAARRRIDQVRWASERRHGAVLLLTHGGGGGVAELVASRAAAVRSAGLRAVVIVPAAGGCRIEGYGDLRFAIPAELPALAALLRDDGATHLEVHHELGHAASVLGLAGLLGIPVEHWMHDAASFCPRIALIGRERRFCGEPDVAACEACVAALGSNLEEPIGPTALVARSAAALAACSRVVVPTADMARRVRRHFPAVRPAVVPWEDDGALPPAEPPAEPPVGGPVTRVCVVGAIGVEKGYDVLLACAADAARRGLALAFVVCGHTEDDERLMAAGPAFVTGRYAPGDAAGLIRAQRAQLGFIPSIWPETWCFALSRVWEAGLPAVAFDLGAPAERIRATGRGHLLPLGLAAGGVNDALLRLAPARAGLQPSRAT